MFGEEQNNEAEKNNRRLKLIEGLSKFSKIGVLVNPIIYPDDLDYLYSQGWELISSGQSNTTKNFYFKKIKS